MTLHRLGPVCSLFQGKVTNFAGETRGVTDTASHSTNTINKSNLHEKKN